MGEISWLIGEIITAKLRVEIIKRSPSSFAHRVEAFLNGDPFFISFDEAKHILIDMRKAYRECLTLDIPGIG